MEGIPEDERTQLGFFEVGIIGFPLLFAATAYIIAASPYLLPDRTSTMQKYGHVHSPRSGGGTAAHVAL